ncbi:MAG: MtrB/PioB family outer membrane beta-barrel protein [Rubrivivax sp.]
MRHSTSCERRLLGLLIGSALAQMAAAPARADSGLGTDTSPGNVLMPGAGLRVPALDPDGIGEGSVKRNPTGLLNAQPALAAEGADGDGWRWRGQIEGGGLKVGGDRDAAKWREYRDLGSGLLLGGFRLQGDSADGRNYLDLSAASLGRDDGFATLSTGRYNGWRLKAFYNETPHVFTSGYRSLWNGIGSSRLTLSQLPAGPTAPATAASTDIAIGEAALVAPERTLSLLRQKGGLRLDLPLDESLSLFASFASEKRQGARPFGMVMGGGGGTGGVETAESIDYDTHEVYAGLQWNGERSSANLVMSASLFRNRIDTLTVESPLFLAPANGIASFPEAVFDLPPDNDYFNLKGEFAHAMPEWANARFTGVVSLASSRQDDTLIPMTRSSSATVNGVAGGAWDTLASLSRDSAERRIDSRLYDFALALQPLAALDVKARLRRYETIDKSPQYWACNPLTGQWGRLINDGSGAVFVIPNATAGQNPAGTAATAYDTLLCDLDAIKALGLVPSAGNVNIGAPQYGLRQDNASLSGDWRLGRHRSLNLLLERETVQRENRERKHTWEDRLKAGWVDRDLGAGTLRLSGEYARRRGSTYVADPYESFYSSSLGPTPSVTGVNAASWIHTSDLMRKFDLADRDTATLNARYNRALNDTMDLSFAALAREQRYPGSAYGRGGTQQLNSLNADWNWQPTTQTSVSATLGVQRSRMNQAGLQTNACVLGSNYYFYSDGSISTRATPTAAQAAAGIGVIGSSGVVTGDNFEALCGSASDFSPLYPNSRRWTVEQQDETRSAGFGLHHEFGRYRFEAHYGYVSGRTSTGYSYNAAALGLVTSGAPTETELAALALIGSGLPDLRYRQHALDFNLVVTHTPKVYSRWLLRWEQTRIADWHYDGVAANPTPSNNQQTYLDTGPQDYRATMFGVLLGVMF